MDSSVRLEWKRNFIPEGHLKILMLTAGSVMTSLVLASLDWREAYSPRTSISQLGLIFLAVGISLVLFPRFWRESRKPPGDYGFRIRESNIEVFDGGLQETFLLSDLKKVAFVSPGLFSRLSYMSLVFPSRTIPFLQLTRAEVDSIRKELTIDSVPVTVERIWIMDIALLVSVVLIVLGQMVTGTILLLLCLILSWYLYPQAPRPNGNHTPLKSAEGKTIRRWTLTFAIVQMIVLMLSIGGDLTHPIDRAYRLSLQTTLRVPFDSTALERALVRLRKINAKVEYPRAMNSEAWLRVTRPDRSTDDLARAITLARRATEIEPRKSYWDTLGCAYFAASLVDEALRIAKEQGLNERVEEWSRGKFCRELALFKYPAEGETERRKRIPAAGQ